MNVIINTTFPLHLKCNALNSNYPVKKSIKYVNKVLSAVSSRLDYQPLFGKMSPRSSPEPRCRVEFLNVAVSTMHFSCIACFKVWLFCRIFTVTFSLIAQNIIMLSGSWIRLYKIVVVYYYQNILQKTNKVEIFIAE